MSDSVYMEDNRTDSSLTLRVEADYDDGAFVAITVTNVHGDDVVDAILTDDAQIAALVDSVMQASVKFRELLDSPPG